MDNSAIKHCITNANIIHPVIDQTLHIHFPNKLDFCYTDPPWNSGNLKYWQTMNKKMTGQNSALITQDQLENRIVELIRKFVRYHAFIVYGKKQHEQLCDKLRAMPGISNLEVHSKKYKSGSKDLPNVIICVTLNEGEDISFSQLSETSGIECLHKVCQMFAGKYKTCLEPFIGVGHYLKVLDYYNFQVAGNELNAKRLSQAMSKVRGKVCLL